MAAYRTAARLFPGLHLPLVGMGMEYARMNNAALAEQLLLAAHRTCPRDALACHELGCLAFRARQLPAAERWLLLALKRVPGRMSAGEYLSFPVESNSNSYTVINACAHLKACLAACLQATHFL